ncbi:MAG: hypothetical protein ABJA84_02005 [Polaromonas sp.]
MSIALFRKPPLATRLTRAVKALFAYGEQGAWLDPSDFSTLFTDSAGTTPVTAVGQPVGLMLDKSKGLVRGPELCTNGTFDTSTGWVLTANQSISSGALNFNNSTNEFATLPLSFTAGKWYEVSCTVVSTNSNVRLPYDGTVANIITTNAPGVFRYKFQAGNQVGLLYVGYGVALTASLDNISVKLLDGNHATQATAANRPVLQQDGNGKYYLAFNGTNQRMSTAAINFSATGKMTVWAGVRKLSDATTGIIAELTTSSANNGSFHVAGPGSNGLANYSIASRGTVGLAAAAATFTSPVTSVLSGTADISVPSLLIRVDGVQKTLSNVTQGSGTYANAALYIGARAGTSLFFNGNLHSLIIRGAASSAGQISSAEAFVASKTGVTL